MSTCASRRDCTGARAAKQRPHALDASRQRDTGACGARHVDVRERRRPPRCVEHRERGDAPSASRSVERAEPDLPRRCASTSANAVAADVDRARRVARARPGSAATTPAASGGDEQRADRRRRGARRGSRRAPAGRRRRRAIDAAVRRDEHDARRRDAHVRGRHVLGDRDAQRAREVARRTVACSTHGSCSTRRATAPVSTNSSGRARCTPRRGVAPSAAIDVLRAGARGRGRRRGAASRRRGTRARRTTIALDDDQQ